MVQKTVIQTLAGAIQARRNCIERKNDEWKARHEATIDDIMQTWLPHGSGFDAGCAVDLDRSTGAKVVFQADYHHMNTNGYYNGWSFHTVTVTPSFEGVEVKISGRDRNNFKEYAHEVIYHALLQPYKLD